MTILDFRNICIEPQFKISIFKNKCTKSKTFIDIQKTEYVYYRAMRHQHVHAKFQANIFIFGYAKA